ncbi:helix-turn-helix domain-containing protein [Flavobacterium covae]
MTSVNDRIKQLRIENNLTQTELADKVGLTYVQIGRYEKGKSTPSADVLQKLANVLNTSTDYLMNGKKRTGRSPVSRQGTYQTVSGSRKAIPGR